MKNIVNSINLDTEIPLNIPEDHLPGKGSIFFEKENQDKKAKSDSNKHHIFLFVNPKSGTKRSAEYLSMDVEKFYFTSKNPETPANTAVYDIDLYIFNLLNDSKRTKGFETLRVTAENCNSIVRVIVAGGDGTVMWIVQEMMKFSVPAEKVAIGVIPFGTGNDFSRVLGWGGGEPSVLVGKDLVILKSLMWKWINAMVEDFDIWDFQLDVYEDGCFKKIISDIKKKPTKQVLKEISKGEGKKVPVKTFKHSMANYFSIGIDARIGFGFEKNRSSKRCLNKCIYCWEGVKKNFLKTLKINSILSSLSIIEPVDKDLCNLDMEIEDLETKTVASTQKKGEDGNIKGNPVTLVCLNINSFMGGASDVWAAAKGKSGLEGASGVKFGEQSFGDSKLEFVTFPSSTSLGLERFYSGRARRVYQGKGPFEIRFQQNDGKGNPVITYFQVDGEFYQVVSPKCAIIKPHCKLPNGKIKVLIEQNSRK